MRPEIVEVEWLTPERLHLFVDVLLKVGTDGVTRRHGARLHQHRTHSLGATSPQLRVMG